jgi:heme A synthase
LVWSRDTREARQRQQGALTRPAGLLLALVVVQITLGALTVLTSRDMWINSVHVVCGALVLTTSLVLTLRTWRPRFADATVPINVRLSARSVRLQPDGTPGVRA